MKSEWRVSKTFAGGKAIYLVYRLRDKDKVHHSGNREEYDVVYRTKEEAEAVARDLNAGETVSRITNYEKWKLDRIAEIESTSIEALARIIVEEGCPDELECKDGVNDCIDCLMNWLNEEAKVSG